MEIRKVVVGPYGVNCYVLIYPKTKDSVIVDPGADAERIMGACRDTRVKYILLTHSHPDHIGAVAEVRTLTRAALGVHPLDAIPVEDFVDFHLEDGSTLVVGNLEILVMHTPGHTPGSVCFQHGLDLISGDTIFPGGPGHTTSPPNLRREIQSIREKILPLSDDTRLHPGHGDSTSLGVERPAIERFLNKGGYEGLFGDVTWLGV